MKSLWNRGRCVGLAALLCLGLCGSARGYESAEFSDLPPNRFGGGVYESVMALTDAGIVNGVGGGRFAPEDNLTAGSFLAMLGRAFYPDEIDETEAAVWWEPYYEAAMRKGLLDPYDFCYSRDNMERDGLAPQEVERVMLRLGQTPEANFNGLTFPRREAAVLFARLLGLAGPPETYEQWCARQEFPIHQSEPTLPDGYDLSAEVAAEAWHYVEHAWGQSELWQQYYGTEAGYTTFSAARIDTLEFASTVTLPSGAAYQVYRMHFSLLPDDPALVFLAGAMVMEDGWLTDLRSTYMIYTQEADRLICLGGFWTEFSPTGGREQFMLDLEDFLSTEVP